MNLFASRLRYYASSFVTLAAGVTNPFSVLLALATFRRPFLVELAGGLRFYARTFLDVWVVKETCLDGGYDACAPAPGMCRIVLDVGAGLGDFALHAARRWPEAIVYAFEPHPESFSLLERNLALNGATRVVAVRSALTGSGPPQAVLRDGSSASEHSTAAGAGPGISVPAATLARVFETYGLERCDFLKIDVEGGEFDILLGADDATLARVHALSIEWHEGEGRAHAALVDRLRACGFAVRLRPSPVHAHLGLLDATRGAGAA